MSQFDDNGENIEQPTDIIIVDEVQEEETLPFLNHCRKILKQVVKKGDRKYFTLIATIAPKTFKVLLTVPF